MAKAGRKKLVQVKDLTGMVFNRYTVKSFINIDRWGNSVWLCECICGKSKEVKAYNLNNGHSQSCGCLNQERLQAASMKAKTKHGLSRTKGYLNAKTRAYQATKLQRTPKWADTNTIQEIYQFCPDNFHVDHELPLQGKLICGLHIETNLQYLYAPLNKIKSSKFQPHTIDRQGHITYL